MTDELDPAPIADAFLCLARAAANCDFGDEERRNVLISDAVAVNAGPLDREQLIALVFALTTRISAMGKVLSDCYGALDRCLGLGPAFGFAAQMKRALDDPK